MILNEKREKITLGMIMRKKITYLLLFYSGIFFSQKTTSNNYFPKMEDYIVTKNLDTLTENIKIKKGLNNFKFYKQDKKISKREVISFRKNGEEYKYKKKRKVTFGDKKYAFLKLIQKGEVNLFEYKITGVYGTYSEGNSFFYYIERNGKLNLIVPERFYIMIKRILPENKKLHKMIKDKELLYENISSVVKYFNKNNEI